MGRQVVVGDANRIRKGMQLLAIQRLDSGVVVAKKGQDKLRYFLLQKLSLSSPFLSSCL